MLVFYPHSFTTTRILRRIFMSKNYALPVNPPVQSTSAASPVEDNQSATTSATSSADADSSLAVPAAPSSDSFIVPLDPAVTQSMLAAIILQALSKDPSNLSQINTEHELDYGGVLLYGTYLRIGRFYCPESTWEAACDITDQELTECLILATLLGDLLAQGTLIEYCLVYRGCVQPIQSAYQAIQKLYDVASTVMPRPHDFAFSYQFRICCKYLRHYGNLAVQLERKIRYSGLTGFEVYHSEKHRRIGYNTECDSQVRSLANSIIAADWRAIDLAKKMTRDQCKTAIDLVEKCAEICCSHPTDLLIEYLKSLPLGTQLPSSTANPFSSVPTIFFEEIRSLCSISTLFELLEFAKANPCPPTDPDFTNFQLTLDSLFQTINQRAAFIIKQPIYQTEFNRLGKLVWQHYAP